MHTKFWSEILNGRDFSEDLGIDGRMALHRMDLREISWEGMDWIHLIQDRDQCWAPMNMVLNL
jgi:hypothetical protein